MFQISTKLSKVALLAGALLLAGVSYAQKKFDTERELLLGKGKEKYEGFAFVKALGQGTTYFAKNRELLHTDEIYMPNIAGAKYSKDPFQADYLIEFYPIDEPQIKLGIEFIEPSFIGDRNTGHVPVIEYQGGLGCRLYDKEKKLLLNAKLFNPERKVKLYPYKDNTSSMAFSNTPTYVTKYPLPEGAASFLNSYNKLIRHEGVREVYRQVIRPELVKNLAAVCQGETIKKAQYLGLSKKTTSLYPNEAALIAQALPLYQVALQEPHKRDKAALKALGEHFASLFNKDYSKEYNFYAVTNAAFCFALSGHVDEARKWGALYDEYNDNVLKFSLGETMSSLIRMSVLEQLFVQRNSESDIIDLTQENLLSGKR